MGLGQMTMGYVIYFWRPNETWCGWLVWDECQTSGEAIWSAHRARGIGHRVEIKRERIFF
jgi:hypothetical protein